MNVEDIIKATNGKLLTGNLEEQCENFCTDTRKIQNGDVYVGLKGEKFNGNEYYKEALEKLDYQGHSWKLSQYASDALTEDVKKIIELSS